MAAAAGAEMVAEANTDAGAGAVDLHAILSASGVPFTALPLEFEFYDNQLDVNGVRPADVMAEVTVRSSGDFCSKALPSTIWVIIQKHGAPFPFTEHTEADTSLQPPLTTADCGNYMALAPDDSTYVVGETPLHHLVDILCSQSRFLSGRMMVSEPTYGIQVACSRCGQCVLVTSPRGLAFSGSYDLQPWNNFVRLHRHVMTKAGRAV